MSACALLLAAVLSADPRARLEALRQQHAAEQAAAEALQRREASLLSILESSQGALERAGAAARAAELERARAERRLSRARADEAGAQRRLDALQAELGPRLRARARLGRLSELRLLLGSTSVADLVKRSFSWRRVVEHDLSLLGEASAAVVQREAARAEREGEASRLVALTGDAERARDVAASRRDEHRALLGAVREARWLHERAAAEAAEAEARLAEFVAALPPSSGGGATHTGFARLKGALPLPSRGPLDGQFGPVVNPRFHTVTVQKGVDILAPEGAEVRAVAPGRVAHAGWFKGYGNLVIVDQGEGWHTLVAHLASISAATGEEVDAGTVLGRVGDTGSLSGPCLHFEIRERGRPVDPRAWLRP